MPLRQAAIHSPLMSPARVSNYTLENRIRSTRRRPAMRYSTNVKSISYIKANAAEVLGRLKEDREPMLITQNGEACAVLQDVKSFEDTQETLALLKLLALGQQDIAAGRTRPVADVITRLRARHGLDKGSAGK